MRPRPLSPGGAGLTGVGPWLILGVFWGLAALAWLAWAAGRLVCTVADTECGPSFGSAFITAAATGDFATAFGEPSAAVGYVYVGFLGLVTAVGMFAAGRVAALRPAGDDPLRSLAGAADVDELHGKAALARAMRLRPELEERPRKAVGPADLGQQLGRLRQLHGTGPMLRSSWEDVVLCIMGTRSGKTTSIAVPQVADAPGAVLATTNRSDLWAATHAIRAKVGTVWLFDPQRITRQRQACWWNPLRAVVDTESADRLADQFTARLRKGSSDPFWPDAAKELLTSLILAAAAKKGGTLADVERWMSNWRNTEPVGLLKDAGFHTWQRTLTRINSLDEEMRSSVYGTAGTAIAALNDPQIVAWITPPDDPDIPELDVTAIPASRDTLYVLSKDGAGSAAPLVAALTDQVLRAGVEVAEAQGGRLRTPCSVILDEVCNICPIGDLYKLVSHFGGRGLCLTIIMQNYRQGTETWGEAGMGALWSTANIILIGAGINDANHCEDLSRLIGPADVPTVSYSNDGRGSINRSVSLRQQRILEASHIRNLPRGDAILLASGQMPAMLRLEPWYKGPHADRINTDLAAAIAAITGAAGRELKRLVTGVAEETGPDPAGTVPLIPAQAAAPAAESGTARQAPPRFRRW